MKKHAVKRPPLVALLSSFVAGLGQLYFRCRKRASVWAVIFLGVGSLSGPDVVAMHLRGASDFWSAVSLSVITLLTTLDAHVAARVQNRVLRRSEGRDGRVCPNCRRAADPLPAFCQWCATELGSVPGPGAEADVDAVEGGTRT